MTTTTTLPILAEGDTGTDVMWAQYLLVLKTLDYTEVDGIFGSETVRAVRDFQSYFGLYVDGVIGPLTWAALRADRPRPPTLQQGSAGPVIKRLQEVLNLGRGDFSPDKYPPLATDGNYGPLTACAVRGTQQMAQVVADGIVGLQTWALSAHAMTATLGSLCGVTHPEP